MKSRWMTAALLVSAATAFASRMPEPPRADPHTNAVNYYQDGERRLDKAAKLAAEAKMATDPNAAAKSKEKLHKTLEAAVGDFKRSLDNDPRLYAAYSEMGFALRKLGRYDESLQAYDKALSMEPGFSPAIEYRAEAHLALNRIDDARQAYLILYSGDRPRADLLLQAMKAWVTERRADAAGLEPAKIDQFANWVTERETIHSQNPGAASSATIRNW